MGANERYCAMGGTPINAFEPLLSARFVALFRAAIVLIFMVAWLIALAAAAMLVGGLAKLVPG